MGLRQLELRLAWAQDGVVRTLYSPVALDQTQVQSTGLLEPGLHIVTMEWAGIKNSWVSDYHISADAFERVGTIDPRP